MKQEKANTPVNTEQNNQSINIKDCLKLIGFSELAANIYAFPKTIKPEKTHLV